MPLTHVDGEGGAFSMEIHSEPLPPAGLCLTAPMGTNMETHQYNNAGRGKYGDYFAGEIFVGGNFATLGNAKADTASRTPQVEARAPFQRQTELQITWPLKAPLVHNI